MDAIFPAALCGVLLAWAKKPEPRAGSWLSWPWWPHSAWWWGAGAKRWIVPAAWAVAVILGAELSSLGGAFAPLGGLVPLLSGAALAAAALFLPSRKNDGPAPRPQPVQEPGKWRLVSLPGAAFPRAEGVSESEVVALGYGYYLVPGEPGQGEVVAFLSSKAARTVSSIISQAREQVRQSAEESVGLCERTLLAEGKAKRALAEIERLEASASELRSSLEKARSRWLARREEELEGLDVASLLRAREELAGEIEHLDAVLRRKERAALAA